MYVLIDEFQDTNKAQLRLSHLVATNSVNEDNPNLMAVGDDDQSIFAFNGAELGNMLLFSRLYPKTKTIVLEENYRSTQEVLYTATTIISQAETRLALQQNFSKNLKAAAQTGKSEISHHVYKTREHQLEFLTRQIKEIFNSDPNSSIAVLARGHASLRDMASFLVKNNVPISYEQQNNILELELVKQIVLLSETIVAVANGDNASASYYLSNLLAFPAWGVDPKTLWTVATTVHAKRSNWLEVLLSQPDKSLVNFANWLLYLSSLEKREPLPVVIEYIIGLRPTKDYESPLRQYYLSHKSVDSSYLEKSVRFILF